MSQQNNQYINKIEEFFLNEELIDTQIKKTQNIIKNFKTNKSTEIAASVLINSL